jgi:hypothetical protein
MLKRVLSIILCTFFLASISWAQKPKATILTPLTGKTYTGGEQIPFKGEGRDEKGNLIPKSNYRWQIIMNHGLGQAQHWHDGIALYDGIDGSDFDAPVFDDHVLSDSIFFRIYLIVKHLTSQLRDTVFVDINPLQSKLTLDTEPSGIKVNIQGYGDLATPILARPTQNMLFVVTAIQRQTVNGETYVFKKWSNGSSNQTIAFTVPNIESKITAEYEKVNAIEKRLGSDLISIYPNPAEDVLNIKLEESISEANIQIIHNTGITVLQKQVDNNSNFHVLDVQALPAGYYFIKVLTPKGYVLSPFSKF